MSTRLKVTCPGCQSSLAISEKVVGKRVRCPACNHRWTVSTVGFSTGQTVDSGGEAVQTRDASLSDSPADMSQSTELPAGSSDLGSIGRFELQAVLGEGAFGIVYRAFDPTLRRHVALKVPRHASDSATRSQRFLTEAHAAANLRHPNIVAVFESGQSEGRLFIVSEYVQGKPLSERTAVRRPPFAQSARWVGALAGALAYAHQEGIVHRDIKPDNILLTDRDRPLIMDFGLAKLTDDDSGITGDGSILGTPAYMSPEQARGETDSTGPHSDQYSLGVVLYELLTGERPFQGPPHHVIAQVAGEDPPDIRTLNQSVPADLAAVCRKSMEKDFRQRYADLNQMAEDLQRWQSGQETIARPLNVWEKMRRWYRRNPSSGRLWGVIASLVILLFIVGSIDYARTKITALQRDDRVATAVAERTDAQRALAINEFERGRKLCEEGDLNQGLLWLAKSLDNLTPEMQDLEAPIRGYLGSWLPHVHRLQHVLPHDEPVNVVATTSDGALLFTGSGDINRVFDDFNALVDPFPAVPGRVQCWSVVTGQAIGDPISHTGAVTCIALSPDGRMVVSGALDGQLKIFDPDSGVELRPALVHPHGITAATFSHDGTMLATACLDEHIRVWDTSAWQEIGASMHLPRRRPQERYHGSLNPVPWVERMAFSPDSGTLFTFGWRLDHSPVRIWDLDSRSQRELPDPLASLSASLVSFTHDGRQVICLDPTAALRFYDWDGDVSQDTLTIKQYDDISDFDLRPGGRLMVTGGGQHTGWVYDTASGEKFGQTLLHDDAILSVDAGGDDRTLITAGRDRYVRIWQVAADRPWGRPLNLIRGSRPRFLPGGDTFFTSHSTRLNDMEVQHGELSTVEQIWNTETLEVIGGPWFRGGGTWAVDFTQDGMLHARGNWHALAVYHSGDGSFLGEFIQHPNKVHAVAFAENDSVVITGCRDRRIRFWDVAAGEMIGEPIAHPGVVNAIAVTPDGAYAAVGGAEGNVQILDIQTRTPVSEMIRVRKSVPDLSFHPTDALLAIACDDGSVHFRTVPEGLEAGPPLSNLGHRIYRLMFHPGGTQIMTASSSEGVTLWDLATRLPASRAVMHGERLLDADLHPAGDLLLTSGYRFDVKDVYVRKLGPAMSGTPAQLLERIETTLGLRLDADGQLRVLDAEEWSSRNPDRLP